MPQTVTLQKATQDLQDDHSRLHQLIDELGHAGDLAQLSAYLTTLHDRLTAHFNAEERPGGLYDTLGFCAAEFRRPLGQLVDDHFRLAATLRSLRERARAIGGVDVDTLRVDVARLVAALAEHERRELELVQRAGAGATATA
jgi:hypothetical protein